MSSQAKMWMGKPPLHTPNGGRRRARVVLEVVVSAVAADIATGPPSARCPPAARGLHHSPNSRPVTRRSFFAMLCHVGGPRQGRPTAPPPWPAPTPPAQADSIPRRAAAVSGCREPTEAARFCARPSPWNVSPRSRSRPRTRRLRLYKNHRRAGRGARRATTRPAAQTALRGSARAAAARLSATDHRAQVWRLLRLLWYGWK